MSPKGDPGTRLCWVPGPSFQNVCVGGGLPGTPAGCPVIQLTSGTVYPGGVPGWLSPWRVTLSPRRQHQVPRGKGPSYKTAPLLLQMTVPSLLPNWLQTGSSHDFLLLSGSQNSGKRFPHKIPGLLQRYRTEGQPDGRRWPG